MSSPNHPPRQIDIPTQFQNIGHLVTVLVQTVGASEQVSPEGRTRLLSLFDVVAGALSHYVDKEFPGEPLDYNVLSLVNSPVDLGEFIQAEVSAPGGEVLISEDLIPTDPT